MNRIKYKLFKKAAEIVSFSEGASSQVEISFNEECEGILSIGEVVGIVKDGVCRMNLQLLEEGEITPCLILKDRAIRLPRIKKSARRISPAPCSEEYIRGISVRERMLSERVELLEEELERLKERLNDKIIF